MFKTNTALNQPNLLAQRMSVLGSAQTPKSVGFFPFLGKKHQAGSIEKRSIILVHWDPKTGAHIARDLTSLGFSVKLESRNPSEAYRAIRSSNPDMVVIDMTVNPSQGLAVYQALRYISTTKNIPVVFVGDEEIDMSSANVHCIDRTQMATMLPQLADTIFTKPE
jgi:CheY-like chemotaxis protein